MLDHRIAITPTTPADLDAVVDLFRAEVKAARAAGRASALPAPTLQADRDFIARWHAGETRYQHIVARRDGHIVGHLRALHLLDRKPGDRIDRPGPAQTTLHMLVVHPDAQGTGIERALVDHLLQTASQHRRTTIRTCVADPAPDQGSLPFWAAMGFTILGRRAAKTRGVLIHERRLST